MSSVITPDTHQKNLSRIASIFPEAVHSWKYFDDGFDSFAYEINEEWIFKIPRRKEVWQMLKREKVFLDDFSVVSPVQVPKFEFFDNQIVGYKKIPGQQLAVELFESLSEGKKAKLAKDFGGFLKKLHSNPFKTTHISDYRNFFNKHGFEKLLQEVRNIILPKLSQKTKENIEDFLTDMLSDEKNFNHIQGIVHSDLYSSHIYWDTEVNKLVGIIDFGEVSKNAITTDFTLIADFCDPRNDFFLEHILLAYSSPDSDLFRKIKLFSRMEKLYWPIEDFHDSVIAPKKLHDFEKNIARVIAEFGQ